jgi:hypothetical protein
VIRNVPRKNREAVLQWNLLVDGAEVLRAGALEADQLTGRDRGVRQNGEDLQLDEEARLEKDIVQEGKNRYSSCGILEKFVAHVIARVIEIVGYRRHPVDLITFANGRPRIELGK